MIWCIIYICLSWLVLGGTWQVLIISVIAYGISISIALSPIGESILRFVEGTRHLATKQEKEHITNLFEEVYEEARFENPNLSPNIELFISDKMIINAFAVGKNTICLTKGAIETFTDDELKGVIAHELGHISNGDTIALLLNVVGNGVFTLFIMGIRLIRFAIELGTNSGSTWGIALKVTRLLIDFTAFVLLMIGEIILAIDSRQNEYQADMFAYRIGYGAELIKALYILQRVAIPPNTKLIDKLRQNHPHLAYRIEKLETAEDEEEMKTMRVG
jgi:heat shock protein HtpX